MLPFAIAGFRYTAVGVTYTFAGTVLDAATGRLAPGLTVAFGGLP